MSIIRNITLLFILWFASASVGVAQQLPQFSYFTYNYINYNPAVTGFTPCLEMRIGYRQQWLGFEGAPKTAYALAHGKFGVKRKSFHGIGGYVENDTAGPFSFTSLHLNYAFHMKISKGYTLASGIGLGFSQYRIDFGGMTLEQQNLDPIITSSISEFVFPQINMGLWLYKSDRFFGISMRQVRRSTVADLADKALRSHLTLTYGGAMTMSDDLTFKPAVLLNYVGQSRASLEGQAMIDYKKRVAFGVGVRGGNGLSALLKLDVIKYLTIAYGYDMTLSKIRYSESGSHEVTLGFRACSDRDKAHVPCAAYD